MTTPATSDSGPVRDAIPGGLIAGRIAGIPIQIAGSWWISAVLLITSFAGFANRRLGEDSPGTALALGILLPIVLLGLVLSQQLVEAAAATRLGVPVVRIRISMPAGTSDYGTKISTPGDEVLIALSGLVVPGSVAAVFSLWWSMLDDGTTAKVLVGEIGLGAAALLLFALLPGLPLIGGRLLRAGLWRVSGQRDAATVIGLAVAGVVAIVTLIWGGLGFVFNSDDKWFQGAIGLIGTWFLLAASRAEAAAEAVKTWPDDVRPVDLSRPLLQLAAETPVSAALAVASGRGVLLVRPDGVAVGLLDQVSAQWLASTQPGAPAERAAEPIRPEAVFRIDQTGQEIAQRISTVPNRQFLLVGPDRRPRAMIYREDLNRVLDIRNDDGSPARWDRPDARMRW